MKNLLWYGPPYSYTGYGLHNRMFLFGLKRLGWNIRLISTEEHIPEALPGQNILKWLTRANVGKEKDNLCINLIPPPALPVFGKYTILYTTLESKTVHEGFLRRCDQFDEVWLPCIQNIKSMKKAGFPRKKLFYVPEGVDPLFYFPNGGKLKKYQSRLFTFFFAGDWSFRKGIHFLLEAYFKTFSKDDNVRLLMLAHYQGKTREESEARVKMEYSEIIAPFDFVGRPKVEFIFDYIDPIDMPSLFNTCDCYVLPTLGEAWSLTTIQAMSCGKPVITTGYGGHMDFCRPDNCFLVPVKKFDYIENYTDLNVDFYKGQLFAFPDVEILKKLMRGVYEFPKLGEDIGKKARAHVLKNWTWDKAVSIADKRLSFLLKKEFKDQQSEALAVA